MNTMNVIYQQEIEHIIRPNVVIETVESEGVYTTTATTVRGTELDRAISHTAQSAEQAFQDMLMGHVGPLQAAFHRAGLKSGQRCTLICIGDFGFPTALRMTYHSSALAAYAQYDDAVIITYTPIRKRSAYRSHLYNRSFLIYQGWRELDSRDVYNMHPGINGATVMESKYACFDERYMDEIAAKWPDYIARYDRPEPGQGDKPQDNEPAKQEPQARAPYNLLPGLTVQFDLDGANGPWVDIEADEFARLYGSEEGLSDNDRLARALKRAAIAAAPSLAEDDGGTCNFDCPALDYRACGMSKAQAQSVIQSVGLICSDWSPFSRRNSPSYMLISGFENGQGNRRTKMAEAFCASMNADGFESMMYYRMD